VIERFVGYTLVRAFPQTGRRHQLRAHFYSLGHPIAGDTRYGARDAQRGFGRLMLHAQRLTLRGPAGEEIAIEAPIPESFRREVDRLRSPRGAD
jgi:23S rRNA-/tRNA-specific pseudouridylate synthase